MEKNLMYATFFIMGVVLFPVKMIVEFVNPQIVHSIWFISIYALSLFVMMVVSAKSKAMKEGAPVPKNQLLSFLSFLCVPGCAWSAYVYFISEKPKDLKVQYTMLSVFCAISALFFAYVCYAHISGKNPFKNLQMLLFAPPIMYLFSISVFFSYEIGKHDLYDLLFKSLALLFFVYYPQNYVEFSDIGHKRKRMITFGLPSALISFGYFFSHMSKISLCSNFGVLDCASGIMHALISIYVLGFLLVGPLKNVGSQSLAEARVGDVS